MLTCSVSHFDCTLMCCLSHFFLLQKLNPLPHKALLAIGPPPMCPPQPPPGGANSNNSSNLQHHPGVLSHLDMDHHNVFNSAMSLRDVKALKWTTTGAPFSEDRAPSPWMDPPTPNILAALDSARDIIKAPRRHIRKTPTVTPTRELGM